MFDATHPSRTLINLVVDVVNQTARWPFVFDKRHGNGVHVPRQINGFNLTDTVPIFFDGFRIASVRNLFFQHGEHRHVHIFLATHTHHMGGLLFATERTRINLHLLAATTAGT